MTPPADSSSSAAMALGPKTWRAGTRVYTLGALIGVFAWLLLGDFAWATRERSVGPMAQWFLNSLNVPNWLFGVLITSFPAALWLLLGPVISVKSDRHRGPRGRRIPFLLAMAPVAALGIIGIGLTPLIGRWLHGVLAPTHSFGGWIHGHLDGTFASGLLEVLGNEMIVSVVCFGVFWTLYELATIAVPTLLGGLINDVVPKELLGRFYGLFRAIGLIDGMIFNFWLMGKVPTHFTLMLVIIGLIYGVVFVWMCLQVKEGEYPPPPPLPANQTRGLRGWWSEMRRYVRECFTNSYYLVVFVMWMLASLCFQPVNVFALPYARSLGVDMDVYGKMLALTFAISLGLSFFIGWLVDKFHPLRMVMLSLGIYAVVTLTASLYATTTNRFLFAWVLHGVASGCYYTCVASLGQRIFPHHKYAQFYSASSLFLSLANIILAPAIGGLIDATGRVYRLTFVFGGTLAVLALVCAWYVHGRFMKLGGPKHYVAPE